MSDTVGTPNNTNEVGNTESTSSRSRGWTWTFNNYTEEEYNNIIEWSQCHTEKYVVGKEVGKLNGTPHLQGYFYFKNAMRFDTLKKTFPKMRLANSKGSPMQNYKYCTKESKDIISKGFDKKKTQQDIIKEEMLEEYNDIKWKPWQQEILDIISLNGNDRKINWVYDIAGNNGKSFLRRYLCLTNECVLADGKKENIFNQFKIKCIDEDKRINIAIMDIPRCNEKWTNYGVIESILDRHIYSGKYEGGEIWLPKMTVIVFANFRPNLEECTYDRWNIIEL